MPTLVVAQKAETFAENRRLVVPHPERGAQRVGQYENRRVLRPFEDVIQLHYSIFGHLISPHDIVSEPGPQTPPQTRGSAPDPTPHLSPPRRGPQRVWVRTTVRLAKAFRFRGPDAMPPRRDRAPLNARDAPPRLW